MKSFNELIHLEELNQTELKQIQGGIVCGGLCVAFVAGLVVGMTVGILAWK